MSGFVFTFCVFPTSFDACYSGLLPEILQAMLEWPKLGFYPKLCVDLVDLSNREQKRQKAKTDIFTGTPFNTSVSQKMHSAILLENIPTMYIVLSYVISNLLTAKVEFLQQGRTINHATSLSAIYVGLL